VSVRGGAVALVGRHAVAAVAVEPWRGDSKRSHDKLQGVALPDLIGCYLYGRADLIGRYLCGRADLIGCYLCGRAELIGC